MSLNTIMHIATSGLFTSQKGIRTVTQNVSNVNTPGYVRLQHNQYIREIGGTGQGVETGLVTRAADRFLAAAALAASSSAGNAGGRSSYLENVQAAFGDPTSSGSIFASLNRTLKAFETGVLNPGSTSARRGAISELQNFLSRVSTISQTVDAARVDADQRVSDQVQRVNKLLEDIAAANSEISRAIAVGDATGIQQRQADMIQELSTYVDVKVIQRPEGTSEIRTSSGLLLAGHDAAKLSFTPSGTGSNIFDRIKIQYGSDPTLREFEPDLQSGSLRGLLDVRDRDLGKIAHSLGELAGGFTDALNAVHNQNATLPPLSSAKGADTGLMSTDALGFTGKTTIAVVNADGLLVSKVEIDFDTGAITVNGVPSGSTGTTIGSFVTALNAALGSNGTATFINGRLQLEAAPPVPATSKPNGFVFDEPETGGSKRGNRAFAHFFGLNDLVQSGNPVNYVTGLRATDAHGFVAGSVIKMQLVSPNGGLTTQKSITIPPGNIGDVMAALNDPNTGLGLYGSFVLDNQGAMKWVPSPGQSELRLELTEDVGPRGTTSLSFGALFGISSKSRELRAQSIAVNPAIVADPNKLGFARPDVTNVLVGGLAVGLADSRGAQALFDTSKTKLSFLETPNGEPRFMTLADFTSSVGGDIGRVASQAKSDKETADSFKDEADARRANVEGVNLDEELVKLTTFQQAYSAAARMIKAVDEMYDTLLQAV
ncbi:flagellar hook-associated protein FlgK [Candidatus Phycosocius spiralis]|uniref:Flagellar hook-associated protein 1 n=1 Tax=Candidatus Phycosocius spiralis TaxID=2815099 RepID=A0ABQ4PTA5_9PROT|nr:flagellar hook-associated protein FlgK [Candidatus Phycosocius spiralis]GIU66220.1 flagellar hook-associated protein FlgK [Candidatus Phycosocius spiralis]